MPSKWIEGLFAELGEEMPPEVRTHDAPPGTYAVEIGGSCAWRGLCLIREDGRICVVGDGLTFNTVHWLHKSSVVLTMGHKVADGWTGLSRSDTTTLARIRAIRAASAPRMTEEGVMWLRQLGVPVPTCAPVRAKDAFEFGVICTAQGELGIPLRRPMSTSINVVTPLMGAPFKPDELVWILSRPKIVWTTSGAIVREAAIAVARDGYDGGEWSAPDGTDECALPQFVRRSTVGTLAIMVAVPPDHPWATEHQPRFDCEHSSATLLMKASICRDRYNQESISGWWTVRVDVGDVPGSMIPADGQQGDYVNANAARCHLIGLVKAALAAATPDLRAMLQATLEFRDALNLWAAAHGRGALSPLVTVDACLRYMRDGTSLEWGPETTTIVQRATWSWGSLDGVVELDKVVSRCVGQSTLLRTVASTISSNLDEPIDSDLWFGAWRHRRSITESADLAPGVGVDLTGPAPSSPSDFSGPTAPCMWRVGTKSDRLRHSSAWLVPAGEGDRVFADERMWLRGPRPYVVGRVTDAADSLVWCAAVETELRRSGVSADFPACMPVVAHLSTVDTASEPS